MSEIGAYIHGLTEDTTPDGAVDFVMTYDHSAGAVKKVTPANLGAVGGGIPLSGWIGAAAMTYVGADDPTYTATMAGDVSTTYQAGQRIKLTQATGGTKYFIITKVAVSGDTTLTLYGGTDYNLENEAISSPYYSPVKAPFGFPLDPTKWTAILSDSSLRTQATPTNNTWYNVAPMSLSIPIGIWNVSFECIAQAGGTDAGNGSRIALALSTANNSASDTKLIATSFDGNGSHAVTIQAYLSRTKTLVLTAKTTYYLNIMCQYNAGNIYYRNDEASGVIRAECTYL